MIFAVAALALLQVVAGASMGKPDNAVTVFSIPDEYFKLKGQVPSGFIVDLLDEVAKKSGLVFTVMSHPELKYDRPNDDGTWDGTLVGELAKDFPTADLAGPDMTATDAGKMVVDFLEPIRTYHLKIAVNPKFGINDNVQYVSIDDADLVSLRDSKDAKLNKIYANVIAGKPGSLVETNAQGVAKVMSGNFAYIGESVYLDQSAKKNAGTLQVLPDFVGTEQTLGFAAPKGYKHSAKINTAISQLKKDGTMQKLFTKYHL